MNGLWRTPRRYGNPFISREREDEVLLQGFSEEIHGWEQRRTNGALS